MPLATYAMEHYSEDSCTAFVPILNSENQDRFDNKTLRLMTIMHKAISIMQFKAEAQLFLRNPLWNMQDRCLLKNIDYAKGIITLDGKEYELKDKLFPTVSPSNPLEFTEEETMLMEKLTHSFRVSEKLQRHIRTILSHGCMYAVYNDNLLFHASVPLNEDGSLKEVEIMPGQKYSGKQLLRKTGLLIRSAFQTDTPKDMRQYAIDYFLYLWCGKDSCLFDKSKMATFERYFISDKETHIEEKGYFFKLRNEESAVDRILDAFEVYGDNRHIINGHVPVHVAKGESPIKAGGRLMVIDGGFAEPYHKETGIAGYTLVYHSRGFELVQHEPFTSSNDAVMRGTDIKSTKQIVEISGRRMLVADTDRGKELIQQIEDLKELLYAYRHGYIKEKTEKSR